MSAPVEKVDGHTCAYVDIGGTDVRVSVFCMGSRLLSSFGLMSGGMQVLTYCSDPDALDRLALICASAAADLRAAPPEASS